MHTLSLSLSHAKKRIEKFTKNVRPFLVKSFTFPIKIVFNTVKSLQMEKRRTWQWYMFERSDFFWSASHWLKILNLPNESM